LKNKHNERNVIKPKKWEVKVKHILLFWGHMFEHIAENHLNKTHCIIPFLSFRKKAYCEETSNCVNRE